MMSREQFQRELKTLAVQYAREIIADQDENRKKAEAAQTLFQALRDAPVWRIVNTPKPADFSAPSENWTQPVKFKPKESDDSAADNA